MANNTRIIVAIVFEEALFTTTDMPGSLLARSSAPNEINAASMDDKNMEADKNKSTQSTSFYLSQILIAVALLAVALVVYRRWIICTG